MSELPPIHTQAPANHMIDRARIRGASRMIATGTDSKDVTAEQIAAVAGDIDLFCRTNDVKRAAVAKAVGYTAGVISEFIKGNYNGNNGQIAIDLEDWLVGEEQRRANQQATLFTWTNVGMQIKGVADFCLDMKKVGLVYGPETSGLGKTTALRAIHQELGPRRCTFVTIDKCDANATGVLKKILIAMRKGVEGNNAQKMSNIIKMLKGRSHLLLVDQIHNLRYAKEDRPFYYLMDIYDATQTGQLWAGTSDMVSYLKRQASKTLDEPLAQIRSRLYPVVDLVAASTSGPDGGGDPLFTVDQIRSMFAGFKLKLTTPAARWLCALARVPGSGGVRICVHVVEYATMLAQSRRLTALDVPVLKQALQCGLTTTNATEILEGTEQLMDTDLRAARTA